MNGKKQTESAFADDDDAFGEDEAAFGEDLEEGTAGDEDLSPEDEQKLIDQMAAEEIAATRAKRDEDLAAIGVAPPEEKKKGKRGPKKAPAAAAGSEEVAARVVAAMQGLKEIGVGDAAMAGVLGVSRATVNNLVTEKRGAKLAGTQSEIDAIWGLAEKIREQVLAVLDILAGTEDLRAAAEPAPEGSSAAADEGFADDEDPFGEEETGDDTV